MEINLINYLTSSEKHNLHQLWFPSSFIWFVALYDRVIGIIFKEVESNIQKNTLLSNFRMRYLPQLVQKFVELVDILVSLYKLTDECLFAFNENFHSCSYCNICPLLQRIADPSMIGSVVFKLQDMLEVLTRDIMVNEIRLVSHSIFQIMTPIDLKWFWTFDVVGEMHDAIKCVGSVKYHVIYGVLVTDLLHSF